MILLGERGYSIREIRSIIDHSDGMVREYLDLYQWMNIPGQSEKLDQLRAMYQHKRKKSMLLHERISSSVEHSKDIWKAQTMNILEMIKVKLENSLKKRIVYLIAGD